MIILCHFSDILQVFPFTELLERIERAKLLVRAKAEKQVEEANKQVEEADKQAKEAIKRAEEAEQELTAAKIGLLQTLQTPLAQPDYYPLWHIIILLFHILQILTPVLSFNLFILLSYPTILSLIHSMFQIGIRVIRDDIQALSSWPILPSG